MIQNPITFVVSNNGTILGGQRGTIRALSNYASKIYVVAPFESVSVKVNYLIYEVQREIIGQYLAPTTLKGGDVLSTNDPQYQTAALWSVWEASISQQALHRIAKYRAGRVGVSFEFTSITQPTQALVYSGLFGKSQSDVLPTIEASGNYYVCDSYNFTSNGILFTKGDYAYSNGTTWLKGQNIAQVAMTTTQDLAVDPSLQAEVPEDISDDEALELLIDTLIGDVGDLSNDLTAHINDLDDPHDTQANQVDGTYRSQASDVQTSLDTIADELDGIIDGLTDITYDNATDEIIASQTVDGALGDLDSALYTHITDLDNPHNVVATQVTTSFNNATVSVANALNTLQATKVNRTPDTITSVSATNKVYVNDGSEKLITVGDLKTSIIEDLVAFSYEIFTDKLEDGTPDVTNPRGNKIYLYLNEGQENDDYEEWIWLGGSTWELVGRLNVDLSQYYTKTETDTLLDLNYRKQLYPNTKNTSTATINKGAVVQFTGSQGDFITIKEANPTEIKLQPQALMGLADEDIAVGAFGKVVWFGQVTNITVNPDTYDNGDILYFDTVNGGLTKVEPSDVAIIVAAVEKVSSTSVATNGILLTRVTVLTRKASEVSYVNTTSGLTATNAQAAIDEVFDALETHINDTTNPHSVTIAQIGAAPTVHTHDDRYYTETELNAGQLNNLYYTETETDTLLSGKSDTGHTHDDRYYTETELNNGQLDTRYYTETEVDTRFDTVNTRLDTLESLNQILGVRWDSSLSTPVLTRTDGAVGLTVSTANGYKTSDFDSYFPYSQIRRCNLADNGIVNAYYGDPDYIEDGTNGQVMVEIPKFYYKHTLNGTVHDWKISPTQLAGYKLHPAFESGGKVLDKFYIGAFEGNGTTLQSIAGVSVDVSQTIGTFRTRAQNRGTGWNIQTFTQTSAIQLLYLIEYANYNSQSVIGNGVTGAGAKINTGTTIGNQSYGTAANETTAMSYRGIENFYGNVFKFVDGLIVTDDGYYYDNVGFNDTALNYQEYATSPITTDGFIRDIIFDSNFDFAWLGTNTTGSSTTYLTDRQISHDTGEINIALFGGFWAGGSLAGAFGWYLSYVSAIADSAVGVRLSYNPF